MAADNSAYDFFLQDNPHKPTNTTIGNVAEKQIPAKVPEVAPTPKITMKVTPPKRGSASKVFFLALSAFLVCFCVIYGRVETNRMYHQISEKNTLLESVQSENVRLKSELESKMTLKNVEDYAVNVLGLQKLDNSQINYVQTQTDDIIEIPEENKNIITKVKEKISGFVEYIFG